jgi:hypothetical protein
MSIQLGSVCVLSWVNEMLLCIGRVAAFPIAKVLARPKPQPSPCSRLAQLHLVGGRSYPDTASCTLIDRLRRAGPLMCVRRDLTMERDTAPRAVSEGCNSLR